MKQQGCLGCEHPNKPSCYSTCETYLAFKEELAKKKAFIRENRASHFAYEHSHVDLAKKKKRRKHK